jgi:hypothetical protein
MDGMGWVALAVLRNLWPYPTTNPDFNVDCPKNFYMRRSTTPKFNGTRIYSIGINVYMQVEFQIPLDFERTA